MYIISHKKVANVQLLRELMTLYILCGIFKKILTNIAPKLSNTSSSKSENSLICDAFFEASLISKQNAYAKKKKTDPKRLGTSPRLKQSVSFLVRDNVRWIGLDTSF